MDNLLLQPNTSKKFFDKGLLYVFLCSLITAGIVFGYYLVKNSGILILCSDFNLQSIPFTIHINDYLKSGGGTWDWSLDLGTGFLEGFSYYNLFSPFLWITLLFPSSKVIYLIGPMYIFKYVVAACLSYTYLKIFVKNNNVAAIGGMLYAFSGFQAMNLVFQFHDAVALFPLLLLGLEKAMAERKKALFIFSVFICCIVNYYIFVSEVVFLIIYFLFRYWHLNKKDLAKSIIKILGCGIIGVGLAAFAFVPNIAYILTSESAEENIWYLDNVWLSLVDSLTIIKGLLLPSDTMVSYSALQQGAYWDSVSAYLPMTGLLLVITFLFKDLKNWLSRIIILLFFVSFSPILSSTFYCFTSTYHRWWFFFVMMMVLSTIIVIDNKDDFKFKKPFVLLLIVTILFSIMIIKLPNSDGTVNVIDDSKFVYQLLISIVGIAITFLMMIKHNNENVVVLIMLILISIFSGITTFSSLSTYVNNDDSSDYTAKIANYCKNLEIANNLKDYDQQYRYCFDYSSSSATVFEMCGNVAGISSFSSTVSTSTYRMYRNFGYSYSDIRNRVMAASQSGGFAELLSGKYYLSTEKIDGEEQIDSFVVDDVAYYVYEQEACPIGFSYDTYISSSYFENIITTDANYKGLIALDSLIVNDEDIESISEYISARSIGEIESVYDFSSIESEEELENTVSEEISALVKINTSNSVLDFARDSKGFTCSTNYEENEVVFFSVPYSSGWTATIDGDETKIYESNGLMYIVVPSGEHSIRFDYKTPGLTAGIIVSLVSLLLLIVLFFIKKYDLLVVFNKKSKKKLKY